MGGSCSIHGFYAGCPLLTAHPLTSHCCRLQRPGGWLGRWGDGWVGEFSAVLPALQTIPRSSEGIDIVIVIDRDRDRDRD